VRDFDHRHGDARGEQSNPDSVLRNDVPWAVSGTEIIHR
jgi:hypothetical protein